MSKFMSARTRNIAWSAFGAMVLSGSVMAASTDSRAIYEQYKRDVAACNSGQSHQDKRTCLQEAGAARQEARRDRLMRSGTAYETNAIQRCARLPAENRAACEAQMSGQNTTTYGSVGGGGVIRETTITVPVGTPGSTTGTAAPATGYAPPPPAGGYSNPGYAPAPAARPSTMTPPAVPARPSQPSYGTQPGYGSQPAAPVYTPPPAPATRY